MKSTSDSAERLEYDYSINGAAAETSRHNPSPKNLMPAKSIGKASVYIINPYHRVHRTPNVPNASSTLPTSQVPINQLYDVSLWWLLSLSLQLMYMTFAVHDCCIALVRFTRAQFINLVCVVNLFLPPH